MFCPLAVIFELEQFESCQAWLRFRAEVVSADMLGRFYMRMGPPLL